MRTLVMGDVHGAYTEMMQALERANFNPEEDFLISLGDLCDRGPDTYEIVNYLCKLPMHVFVRGNHDQWFIDWLNRGVHPDDWVQGGYATAESYAANAKEYRTVHRVMGGINTNLTYLDIPEEHRKYWNNSVYYYVDDKNNLYIHGGMNRHKTIKENTPIELMWDRDFWSSALSYKNAIDKGYKFKIKEEWNNIFIGHTSTIIWDTDKPMSAANDKIWNLDTGGGFKGRITVMDVDTKEYWQSEIVNNK